MRHKDHGRAVVLDNHSGWYGVRWFYKEDHVFEWVPYV
jgi:hypothetical protein